MYRPGARRGQTSAATGNGERRPGPPFGADDRARTGDLNLGKVALYQLSYVRREEGCYHFIHS